MRMHRSATIPYQIIACRVAIALACAFVMLVPLCGSEVYAKAGQPQAKAGQLKVQEAATLEEYIELTPEDVAGATFEVDKATAKTTGEQDITFEEAFGVKASAVRGKPAKMARAIEQSEDYELGADNGESFQVLSTYGLKRVLVDAAPEELEAAGQELFGAVSAASYDGRTLLSFETEEKTKEGYEALTQTFGEDRVLLDVPVTCDDETSGDVTGDDSAAPDDPKPDTLISRFKGWGTEHLGLQNLLARYESGETILGSSTGDKLTIAIVDTGVYAEHEIFEGTNFSEHSRNFVAGSDGVVDPANLADNYSRYDKAKDVTLFGHGTGIAGIITESTPKALTELMIIKVIDREGTCGVVQLLQAIEYAAEHGADVINMSLGGNYREKNRQVADKMLGEIVANGPVICASAGNSTQNLDVTDINYYPAESPYVVCVGAVGQDNKISRFSSYGSSVDFAAPGEDLQIACSKETAAGNQAEALPFSETAYEKHSGTSFACPYITACMAYLKLAHPDHTIWSGRPGLAEHASGFDSQRKDLYYGYGVPYFAEDAVLGPAQSAGVFEAAVNQAKLVYNGQEQVPDYTASCQGAEVIGCGLEMLTDGKTIGTHQFQLTLNGCFADPPVVTKSYKIVPKAIKLNNIKVKKVKSSKTAKAGRISWTKGQKHYQLQVAQKKNFKGARSWRTGKRALLVKGLKQGKTYYVRVRTYKIVDGTKYYSAWSKTRSFKAK